MTVDPESAIFGVKEVFLCFVALLGLESIMSASLFYVTGECHRLLHRG